MEQNAFFCAEIGENRQLWLKVRYHSWMNCTTLAPQSTMVFAKKGKYVRFLMAAAPDLMR